MSEALALSLTGLAKRYANGRGIQDVALQIPRRAIYCLLGPNGAGKSTTLGILAGWFGADAGTMALGGVNVDVRRPGHRVGLGFVPDVPILDEALNGWEWASYVTAIKGRAWPHELATEIASQLLIDELSLSSAIGTLSLGTRRKVALWIEFATTEHLLVLDEPLTGLDPHAIAGFHAAARAFAARGGAVLMSTHLVNEAEALATHVGIMSKGCTVIQGPLSEVAAGLGLLEAFQRAVPV